MSLNKKVENIIIFFIIFLLLSNKVFSQISIGGIPESFKYDFLSQPIQSIELQKPDLTKVFLEDEISDKKGEAYRMGILLEINKGIHNSGTWTILGNGDKIWRLRIQAKGALATSLYYDRFYLPKGSKMYIYNDKKEEIKGAFSSINNNPSGLFATELTSGDAVIIEYYQPNYVKDTVIINISDINYAYRGALTYKYGFGSSGPCEVNVNCSEGLNWQKEKRGVVRINVRAGGSSKWCTGSLVNNTKQDYKPYLLTADHCEIGVSASDLAQWIFYFNYESPDCSNPATEGTLNSQSLTGAVKIADGGDGGNSGSDFLLLLLNNEVPISYNPCFLGWDKTGNTSNSGVCIHHPAGDIKKISTYSSPLISSFWINSSIISHWQVVWTNTINGHGVTEGGSSGSPIFNESGKIIGTLTGGDALCTNLTGPDYFGKFDWHWDKNGNTPQNKLKDWLDPLDINPGSINHLFYSNVDFEANINKIKANSCINFTDKSTGGPYQYHWVFPGATPNEDFSKNPQNICYSLPGNYDVTLNISNSDTSFSITKTNYIIVWNDINVYSINNSNQFAIELNNNFYEKFTIKIFDLTGREVWVKEVAPLLNDKIKFNVNNINTGIYIIQVLTPTKNYQFKVSFFN